MFCNLHPRLQACIALYADINLYFYGVNVLLGALVRSWPNKTIAAAVTNITTFKNQCHSQLCNHKYGKGEVYVRERASINK